MQRYRLLALLFVVMLVAAACSESTGSTETTSAPVTTAPAAEAHETGEEDAPAEEAHEEEAHEETVEESAQEEEAHEEGATEEAAHEEGDEHGEEAHEETDGHDMEAMEADRTVEVIMTDFAFDVDPITVSAGETVEFVITNAGVIEHEFRVSNDHRVEEHIASGHDDHDENEGAEGGHHEEDGDQFILIQPGETASLMVMFGEDLSAYTNVVCLVPGHYEAGMAVDLEYIG